MAFFNRRVKTAFAVGENKIPRVTVPLRPVTLEIVHRTKRDRFTAPVSQLGRVDEDILCVLYFDIRITEQTGRNKVESATVSVGFREPTQVLHISPREGFNGHASVIQYNRETTLGPEIEAPNFARVRVGQRVVAQQGEGPPDWRFSGNIQEETARWTWTRGALYNFSRGLPVMQVGTVLRNVPVDVLLSDVVWELRPRSWYRIREEHSGTMHLRLPRDEGANLETAVHGIQSDVWGVV